MGRKPVTRSLPPLPQLVPAPPAWRDSDNKSERVTAWLGEIARQQRTAKPTPFYPARQVAAFLGVSLHTVHTAYQELARQGILVSARGSGTLLRAVRPRPRAAVHGVVVVPVWTPGFIWFANWREFFMQLDAELRQRHLVANLLFLREGESITETFVKRILAHRADYLLWLLPPAQARPALQHVAESGVRVVTLEARRAPVSPVGYRLDKDAALARAFADWRDQGIRVVELARPEEPALPEWTPVPEAAAKAGLELRPVHPAGISLDRYVASLGSDPERGVAFLLDDWYYRAWEHAPAAMQALTERTRVMCQFTLQLPPALVGPSTVDLIDWDWPAVAVRIATDLASGQLPRFPPLARFDAHWQRQPATGITLR